MAKDAESGEQTAMKATHNPADCICGGATNLEGMPRFDIVCPCCDGVTSSPGFTTSDIMTLDNWGRVTLRADMKDMQTNFHLMIPEVNDV